jgi:hypothetical protein
LVYILTTDRLDRILQTYSLEEILEYNDISEEAALSLLCEDWDLEIPVKPVDYEEETS